MSGEKVDVGLCKLMHTQLEKRCDERHAGLDDKIDRLCDSINGIGDQLRSIVLDRATDRAWAIIGKYGMTLIALAATFFGIARYLKSG